jgi:outer membrane protein OmpA-like peptidoglycan-associated protein
MKVLNTTKSILIYLIPLFLIAFNFANSPLIDRLTIVTDESWEVSKEQPTFSEYPLSKEAILAAHAGLKGGNAQAVIANYYSGSTLVEGTRPIWRTQKASNDWENYQFKKVFMLRNNLMSNASIKINCDDIARIYINGQLIGEKDLNRSLNLTWRTSTNFKQLSADFYNRIFTYDIKSFLIAGALNTIIIEAASKPVSNGHAYISAKLDVDFIENTIALKPVIKPTIKPEKKPIIVVKKPIEKVAITKPKKEIIKTDPSVKPVENQPIIESKPIIEAESNVFKTSTDVNINKLKIGDIFELGNIYFKADNYELNSESQATLLELAVFLKANNSIKIEIGGHTNLLPTHEYADKLSSDRAKSVVDFLKKNGIPQGRLTFKGYGKNKPKLMEKTTEANQKNQRVEVKILAK